MEGLQKRTHSDREAVIHEMIPLIRRKFGDNLIALAAQASYARNEDSDYSDLELVAFVKEIPEGPRGMGKVRNGLLVELVWKTKETYLSRTKEVTDEWYIAGSDTLLPIINEDFVAELNRYHVEDLKQKCLNYAAHHWQEVQESTAKVLNAIASDNRDGIPLLLCDMVRNMLVVLSFLNQTPYVTFATFISQAREFALKPAAFDTLADIVVNGTYRDLPALERVAIDVFSDFEKIFAELGHDLYDDNVDPNIRGKEFV